MKYIKGFLILCLCLLIGVIIKQFINFPIPDSVYGMAILLIALLAGWVSLGDIEDTSNILLDNLAFLFVAPGVGLIKNLDQLAEIFIPFLVIIIVSTFVVMLVTSKTVQAIQNRRRKK